MQNITDDAFEIRNRLISDKYRPKYHFAFPYGCDGQCGDPNGAFYADGRYHLMYLYKRDINGYKWYWGHISSADLLHWTYHKDALTVSDADLAADMQAGSFSGGAFLDDDGTAYIVYWAFSRFGDGSNDGSIRIASAKAPYDDWVEMQDIVLVNTKWGMHECVIDGKTEYLGAADPSNIWKMNGYYYVQMGNLPVLNEFGRSEDSPEKYKGGWTELFRSRDLKKWEFVHRFYDKPAHLPSYPDDSEDDMCPSFLPLYDKEENGEFTGKYLQLFIAHNRGCQYYIGHLDGEKFIPESHGRMTWNDSHYFAPEALVDDKKRHVIWAWLMESYPERRENIDLWGYNGVYSFPRNVWLCDGVLHMSPAKELEKLECGRQSFDVSEMSDGDYINVKNPVSFRLRAEFDVKGGKCGFTVLENPENGEKVEIYYDAFSKKLVCDTSSVGKKGARIKEEAPFELSCGEKLYLDIFVDKSIVEVYANKRQAVCRQVFATVPEKSVGVKIIGEGIGTLSCSEVSPSFEI